MTRVLLVAVSARMLAELAHAAGAECVAYDRFGDADLRRVCPGVSLHHDLGGRGGMAALVAHAQRADAGAVVYGAGLENRPDLVARLARGRELLGCPPAVLAEVRDPLLLGAALRADGLAAPAVRRDARGVPPEPGRWLRKPLRGGGGRGVRGWRGGVLAAGELLQERRAGVPCSAVALADGHDAVVLAITEQLVGEGRLGARGFAWCGNVAPPRLEGSAIRLLTEQLTAACRTVARRFGVVGAFGVDAVFDGETAWVLEVNPRPTAGLEVADRLAGGGAFAVHAAACRGMLPGPAAAAPAAPRAAAKVVLYSPADVLAPPPRAWGRGARDLPHAGEPLHAGQPVCTLVGEGGEPMELTERLLARAERLSRRLLHAGPVPAHA